MKRTNRKLRPAPRALTCNQLPRISAGFGGEDVGPDAVKPTSPDGIWIDIDRTSLSDIRGGVQKAREAALIIMREDDILAITNEPNDPLAGVE